MVSQKSPLAYGHFEHSMNNFTTAEISVGKRHPLLMSSLKDVSVFSLLLFCPISLFLRLISFFVACSLACLVSVSSLVIQPSYLEICENAISFY